MKNLTILFLATLIPFFSAHAAEAEEEFVQEEESLLSLEDDEDIIESAILVQLDSETIESEGLIVSLEPEVVALEMAKPVLAQTEESTNASQKLAFTPLMQQKTVQASSHAASQFNINLEQVFKGAPTIYTLLFVMSMATVFIWFYNLFKLNHAGALSEPFLKELRQKLHSNEYEEALALCSTQNSFFCKMLAAGIAARSHGLLAMIDTMKTEGKRVTITFWQRLAVLNDIALIAPMLGLLGTVLGMFYAFYDLNRSMESFSILFDGLGISVGTTVAGLIVAILALILNSIAKYRLVRLLVRVENEAQSFASLIDNKNH